MGWWYSSHFMERERASAFFDRTAGGEYVAYEAALHGGPCVTRRIVMI